MLVVALVAAGCGGGKEPAKGAAPPKAAVVDPVSGRPLEEFKGQASYAWRKNLVTYAPAYLAELGEIRPALKDEHSLRSGLNVCQEIAAGETGTQLQGYIAKTFREIKQAEAAKVEQVIRQNVCPEL